MKAMKAVLALILALIVLGAGGLIATRVLAQTPSHQHDVEKRLSDKRIEAEAHRKQMEAIKDPEQLSVEMRKHFQMTEDILALMLERRKVMEAQAPKTAPATSAQPTPGMSGMPGGMMGKEMGGMGGGMMQKEMGGMQSGPGRQGQDGMKQKEMQKEMGGMTSQSPTAPSAPPAKNADTELMMQRLGEHSKYMETMQDRAALNVEMLRHQKMLDQMLELMQQ